MMAAKKYSPTIMGAGSTGTRTHNERNKERTLCFTAKPKIGQLDPQLVAVQSVRVLIGSLLPIAGKLPCAFGSNCKRLRDMSESQSSSVLMFDNSDPQMQRAYEQARTTFRYFWREVAWDRRRIVPALDLACIKVPFCDTAQRAGTEDTPEVEHMWLSDVDFDGQFVTGLLANTPNWLTTVKEGDAARFRVAEISDWMFVISGKAYGAFTVNLLRSRMSDPERKQHDSDWDLDFGDPTKIRMPSEQEHLALSEAAAASLQDQLAKTPSLLSATGHNGWTLLHQDASAGSAATVKVLLEAGASPIAVTEQGLTPLQLANELGWDAVTELLARR